MALLSFVAGGTQLAAAAPNPEAEAAFERALDFFTEARAYSAQYPADREEIARRYRLAADSFVAAWQAGAASVEVFVNAANSFHFAGEVAEAVLHYRRALALDPLNDRAQQALQHIRSTLPIRKPSGGATGSLLKALFFWHGNLSLVARKTLFMVLFPAAFLFFAVSLWRKRPFRLLGGITFVLASAFLASLLVDAFGSSLRDAGVVLVEVQGRRGDGPSYSPSHSSPFPAGTEVTIRDVRAPREPASMVSSRSTSSDGTWLRVRLLDGSESWLPEGAVERVLRKGL